MISVVIPVYNSEDTIVRTLESVRRQTALNEIEEIIVVNDGSKDNSLKTIMKYLTDFPHMPIIVIDKPNGGVSSARNAGIKLAVGEIIALLDSDDEWLPEKTQIQLNIMREHPEIDFLGCDVDDKALQILFKKPNTLYKASIKDLCLKNFPATPAAMFKKNIIEKTGLYDETQFYAEDGNFFLRVCSKCNYYHLPQSLVNTGCGKPSFGYSGLSANLKGMYDGNLKNIQELESNNLINNVFYVFLRIFYWIKYIRRIIITKYMKLI